ncbi:MAG TPA: uracil-DNA glycosylase [Promineifilum sp.]|nr:uracil-DNA glycosylase [Promineifilum sp.]
MEPYDAFVWGLSAAPLHPGPGLYNPYGGASAAAAIRRANLVLYLRRMAARAPRLLLVGEAPGYRGCRLTGVPFTSEFVLLTEPTPFDLFGEAAGFRLAGAPGAPKREATATVFWQTVMELERPPLLWNALPFHPFLPGNEHTNRTPSLGELATGEKFIAELLVAFQIDRIVAVGRKAAEAMSRWGISAARVRHPGHGGKDAFRRELIGALGAEPMAPGP